MRKLYLILSTNLLPPSSLKGVTQAAIRGGVDWVQFRHKEMMTQEMFEIAREIRALCREKKVPFIVNDRFDLALLLDADGLHLGQTDVPIPVARRFWPKGKMLGVSAASTEEVDRAVREGADYVGIGHVFPTGTKLKTTPPLGPDEMQKIASICPVPLFPIGGIGLSNVASILFPGVSGVAIASAICSSPDVENAAKSFKVRLYA